MLASCCCSEAPDPAGQIEFDPVGDCSSALPSSRQNVTLLQQHRSLQKQTSMKDILHSTSPSAALHSEAVDNKQSCPHKEHHHHNECVNSQTTAVATNVNAEDSLTNGDVWLLNAFVKMAKAGCVCSYLGDSRSRGSWGNRMNARYVIDDELKCLNVVVAARGRATDAKPKVSCRIDGILDIYSLQDDGEECFPREVIQALRPDERDLLLMIVYDSGTAGESHRFCFVETSPESKETLLHCLRILSIKSVAGQVLKAIHDGSHGNGK